VSPVQDANISDPSLAACHKAIPGNVSLVIAITGHRDLNRDDYKELEEEVGEIFKGLCKQYPKTPLLLLSGLAEGADSIAARAAKAASIPYIAVLPMPLKVYRTDFKSEASDDDFQKLLDGAERYITLPLAEGSTLEKIAEHGPARDTQYERLGEFLVNYSQILIAIWDKKRIGKKGGASDVVAMKLGQKRESGRMAIARMNGNGAGPVYELLARRISTGEEKPTGVKSNVEHPDGSTAKDYQAIYKLLDQYNADVEQWKDQLAGAAAKSRQGLFEDAVPTGLTPAMNWLADVYSWADTLAIHFSTRSLLLWKAVFGLLGIGGVALTWLHTLDGGWLTLFAYYACLGFAFAAARWEIAGKRRDRHEDYRALAEALRVQFFWIVAGLPDLAAEKYLRKQAGEMVWIRDAMSECGLYEDVLERSHGGQAGEPSRLGLAQTWIEGQAKYFSRRSAENLGKKTSCNVFASVAAGIGLVAPLVGLLIRKFGTNLDPQFEAWSHAVAAIAMWWAALVWNYAERRGFLQEARQYARMYDLFHAADEDLKKYEKEGTEKSFLQAEAAIRELGHEALAENGDWLAMHRERKLTPNIGAG